VPVFTFYFRLTDIQVYLLFTLLSDESKPESCLHVHQSVML